MTWVWLARDRHLPRLRPSESRLIDLLYIPASPPNCPTIETPQPLALSVAPRTHDSSVLFGPPLYPLVAVLKQDLAATRAGAATDALQQHEAPCMRSSSRTKRQGACASQMMHFILNGRPNALPRLFSLALYGGQTPQGSLHSKILRRGVARLCWPDALVRIRTRSCALSNSISSGQ